MGRIRVGPQAIREYLGRMRERYERVERTAKGRLLDEVCEVTGYHRKAAIRLLRRPETRRRRRRGGRPVRYGPEVVAVLRAIWTAAGYPWSVRLRALLPLWLPWAQRRLRLTDAVEQRVRTMSLRHRWIGVSSGTSARCAAGSMGARNQGRCSNIRFRSGRIGGPSPTPALRRSTWWRIPATALMASFSLAERDRPPHHVGGDARRAGERPAARAGRPRGDPAGVAVPPAGHRFG